MFKFCEIQAGDGQYILVPKQIIVNAGQYIVVPKEIILNTIVTGAMKIYRNPTHVINLEN